MIAQAWRYLVKTQKNGLKYFNDEDFFWIKVIWWVVFGLSVLVLGTNLGDVVSHLLNPEYWALKGIVK